VKKVKVELKKPHTHAGREYGPGDTVDLWQDQAEWLVGTGVAVEVSGNDAGKKASGKEDK